MAVNLTIKTAGIRLASEQIGEQLSVANHLIESLESRDTVLRSIWKDETQTQFSDSLLKDLDELKLLRDCMRSMQEALSNVSFIYEQVDNNIISQI